MKNTLKQYLQSIHHNIGALKTIKKFEMVTFSGKWQEINFHRRTSYFA